MEKDVTRNIEEQLSAFLDGQLPEEELQLLVRRLERDPEYRATLARYATIGSVLRRDPVQVTGDDLRQRLMIAMQDDNSDSQDSTPSGNSVFLQKRGLLVAGIAALVVAGLYTGNFYRDEQLSFDRPKSAELARTSPAEVFEPAGNASEQPSRAVSVSAGVRRAALHPDRMTSYLVSHGEFSRSFQGAIVDSRIFVQQASYEE